ncbi:BlaI/MecI/CopY family transcriptional regulator [Glycocaulis profundi]|nr:BlaI/MecI/CopY family transcriptional regulator [Glycocaulis profundi]
MTEPSPEPNASELDVLKALWKVKEASAREIHEAAGERRGWSYSTTRTVLARMVDKGLAVRRDSHGLTLFAAAAPKVDMIGRLVRGFARRVLEIDGELPASAFSGSRLLDADDLAALQLMLDEDAPADENGEGRS